MINTGSGVSQLRLVADADDIWETDASDPAAPQFTSVSPLRMSSFCSISISVPKQELFLYKKEQTDVESEMGDCFVYPLFSLSAWQDFSQIKRFRQVKRRLKSPLENAKSLVDQT